MTLPTVADKRAMAKPLDTSSGDILADRMPLAHAQVGDLVVVFQSGAYGASASPAMFLGHPPALEVLV